MSSTDLFQYLGANLSLITEEFENILENNNDAMVYVDGEEGDFGVVRYYLNGVLMMVKYVGGGDQETTYYTAEGNAEIRKLLLEGFEDSLDDALRHTLNPEKGLYGLNVDEILRAKKEAGEL